MNSTAGCLITRWAPSRWRTHRVALPISQTQEGFGRPLFLALTRCKYRVICRIGCSLCGAGEFARGNPWDLPCKLRPAPAAEDEAGFPQASPPAADAASPGGLGWSRAALVPGWPWRVRPIGTPRQDLSVLAASSSGCSWGATRLLSTAFPGQGTTARASKMTCAEAFKARGRKKK